MCSMLTPRCLATASSRLVLQLSLGEYNFINNIMKAVMVCVLLLVGIAKCGEYECQMSGKELKNSTEVCKLETKTHKCTKTTHCQDNEIKKKAFCTIQKTCVINVAQVHIQCQSRGFSEVGDGLPVHSDIMETCTTKDSAQNVFRTKKCHTTTREGKVNTQCQSGQ